MVPLLKPRLREEDGSVTILALYFFVISLILGGLAIDFLNREAKHTKMQTATDNVGHAALHSRRTSGSAEASATAVALAEANLSLDEHGLAITASDIEFGHWDGATRSFLPDTDAREAVRVTAHRDVERDNIVSNVMLQAAGYDGFEVSTSSVFTIWEPPCFKNGMIARHVVDVQSNNFFGSNFCMHGNDYVSLNIDNFFAPGSIVSMPDQIDLLLPASGFEKNDGLIEALRSGYYQFNVLDEVAPTIQGLENGDPDVLPDYVYGALPVTLPSLHVVPEDFEPGRLHTAFCNGNQLLALDGGLYEDIALVTNCRIKFNNGVTLQDVLVASSNTTAGAMSAPSGLRLGLDDNCSPGGGAQLLTVGGVQVAASLEIFGSQIIALGDIDFSAQADGLEGVSMIAGNDINTSSIVAMNGCPETGMDLVLWERMIRMVE